MNYDQELKDKLSRKLEKIWLAALRGEDFSFSYKLTPPVELSKCAGRIHEVNAWAAFWKQSNMPWILKKANRKAGIMGMQNDFPVKAEFTDAESALRYLGEWKDFTRLQECCQKLLTDYPQLRGICAEFRKDILRDKHMAENIWQLACYFSGSYRENCYVRELDIPHVDTKFIEDNGKLTAKIFYALHPECEGRSYKDLCEQLHWQTQAPTPNIYLRSLDEKKSIGGLQELMVTSDQLSRLAVSFSRIFITENKVNGFVFPPVKDGLIIFGAGNGVIAGEEKISWLEHQPQLWYWGDMDRDGWRILSRVREKYPKVRSFLMKREMAEKYRHFMVADNGSAGERPANLTVEEQECWDYLAAQPAGANRLEQEKIPIMEIKAFLQSLED